tara:strand:- start:110 stop:1375 length:1266 start_codon:yes stop_codon:yes gene_type:complete
MKLASLIDEKFGLPGNLGREFGERYVRDFINPGKFAELWTAFETTYPELKPELTKTFEKTNDLFKYIKPEKGGEAYRVSTLPEAAAQELDYYLDNILAAIDELSNLDKTPDEKTVSDAIQYFDGLFQDMLNIFTSNTAGDAPLEPYKKTSIGFGSSQYNEDQIREIIKESLNELEGSVNYSDFFKKIINRLDSAAESNREFGNKVIEKFQDLDISIDYLSSVMTGISPHEIGTDQDSQGVMTGKAPGHVKSTDEQKLREVIKKIFKEEKPGLWANIRAKRASGRPMAKKGSKAYKSAKKAGDKINKNLDEVNMSIQEVLDMDIINENITEAKYKGKTVTLNKPMRGDSKKFKVYVNSGKKNADGSIKVKKVNFGHGGTSAKRPTMRIRKSNAKRRKAFRARHRCDNPGPKTMARYWSCKKW